MRPVRLSLHGFASFREPQVIDFSGADYFALVGPTGSGKSTVLDALSFALYGTAPRWGGSNVVRYALAPTSNQAVVSLVFDVDGQRYEVAREVRRVGEKPVQRNVSLVRFSDPAALEAGEGNPAEPIAGSIAELNPAIVELLGLDFEDFCQCVVLPQGQFAKFLTASAATRQEILLKLLGAARYEDKIGRRAHELYRDATQRVQLLTDQAERYAAVDQYALDELTTRVAALRQAHEQCGRDLATLRSHRDEARAQQERSDAAGEALSRLRAVREPASVAGLQRRARQLAAEADSAATDREAAELAYEDARAAQDDATTVAALEQFQRQYAQRGQLLERRQPAQAAVLATAEHEAQARTALAAAETELEAARRAATESGRAAHDARSLHQQAAGRLTVLAAVQAPADLELLAARRDSAGERHRLTEQAQRQAVSAQERARTDLDRAPGGERVQHAERLVQRLRDLTALTAGVDEHARAAAARTGTAEQAVAEADTAATQARDRLDEARVHAGAAALRPALALGHECPVCDQTVAVLPAPLPAPLLEERTMALAAAEDAGRRSQADLHAAQKAQQSAEREADRHHDTVRSTSQSLHDLVGSSDLAEGERRVAQWRGERARCEQAVTLAGQAVAAASEALQTASAELTRVQTDLDVAGQTLHAALGRLSQVSDVPAGVAAAATEPVGGWAAVLAWLPDQRAAAASDADQAAAAAADAAATAAAADRRLTAAERHEREASETVMAARTAAIDAVGELSEIDSGLLNLTTILADAPPEEDLPAELARAADLAAGSEAARGHRDRARAADQAARAAAAEVVDEIAQARKDLGSVRDTLAGLAPPAVDDDDLAAAWAELAGWARTREAAVLIERDEAGAASASALTAADDHTARMRTALIELGVDAEGDATPETLATQVVRVLEGERHRLAGLQQDLAESARLAEQIAESQEEAQVARELAHHMNSKKFPQWLAGSALDALVGGASASLRLLSGDQFDLTHRNGEFYVIDHADADSHRSVRTLSGGETFQASLALALSLADHLAGMLGGATLDSIFLDEGFGTLDPDSLETVAATLENLAGGDRTVGVITHVTALADRAPVRFQVRRDARSSTITREGA